MPESISHEEISQRFLDSGAVNYEAAAKFVAEIGPELAIRDEGLHGVIFGRYNMIACFKRWDDIRLEQGGLRDLVKLTEAIDIVRPR